MIRFRHTLLAAASLACAGQASAFTFSNELFSGSFDSTLTTGFGVRTRDASCGLVNAGATGGSAPAGCLDAGLSSLGDQGDLNYGKGDPFTAYLKGNHELLAKLPAGVTLMARGNWMRDFASTHTTGTISGATLPGTAIDGNGLSVEARRDLRFKGRVLDLWLGKSFKIGDQTARIRIGNQAINWGESLFIGGGINATSSLDIMRLSQPGTQLKEAILPAPMLTFATGIATGLSAEAYVQSRWNGNYFPPTGSYWSTANGLGQGHDSYGVALGNPKKTGQWGTALRYQPEGTSLNLAMFAMNYHDKGPSFTYNFNNTGTMAWAFPEDRKLYGISANFPAGDWALGTELSYRPKDAVALNSFVGCADHNGNCWVDEKKYQWAGTGLLSLTPSNARGLLDALGADTGTLMAEAVVIAYPKLQQFYGTDMVASGGWNWGGEYGGASHPMGSKVSAGYNFDFSLVYDGSLIEGWQVVPEVYFFHAVKGHTPTAAATFMQGAKSVNLIVSFIQNPANWQFGLNYAKFWGGSRVFDQPLRDRDFVGAYLSRNF